MKKQFYFKREKVKKQTFNIKDEVCISLLKQNPCEVIKKLLSGGGQRIFNYLFLMFKQFGAFKVSQSHIARIVGLCRQEVNEILQQLQRFGFITITNRGYKKTCEYNVNSFFLTLDIMAKLSTLKVFWALKVLSISLLLPSPSAFTKEPTHINRNNYLYLSSTSPKTNNHDKTTKDVDMTKSQEKEYLPGFLPTRGMIEQHSPENVNYVVKTINKLIDAKHIFNNVYALAHYLLNKCKKTITTESTTMNKQQASGKLPDYVHQEKIITEDPDKIMAKMKTHRYLMGPQDNITNEVLDSIESLMLTVTNKMKQTHN